MYLELPVSRAAADHDRHSFTCTLTRKHTQGLHQGPGGTQYLELQQILTVTHTHVLSREHTHEHTQGLHQGPGGIQYLELQQIPNATIWS